MVFFTITHNKNPHHRCVKLSLSPLSRSVSIPHRHLHSLAVNYIPSPSKNPPSISAGEAVETHIFICSLSLLSGRERRSCQLKPSVNLPGTRGTTTNTSACTEDGGHVCDAHIRTHKTAKWQTLNLLCMIKVYFIRKNQNLKNIYGAFKTTAWWKRRDWSIRRGVTSPRSRGHILQRAKQIHKEIYIFKHISERTHISYFPCNNWTFDLIGFPSGLCCYKSMSLGDISHPLSGDSTTTGVTQGESQSQ